jgi:hypothetical protein
MRVAKHRPSMMPLSLKTPVRVLGPLFRTRPHNPPLARTIGAIMHGSIGCLCALEQ